jgi:hypothetical protein
MRTSLLILLAFAFVPAASAAGPWLGTATNGVGFTAVVRGGTTVVADGSHSLSIPGKWGIPRVTLDNGVGGLSADGRTLVLGQADVLHPNGDLVKSSSFAVLSTKPMRLRQTVTIKGDFGFDALSPHGRTVYLIQRSSAENLSQYRVRAYDLVEKRLLSRVVADKRQRDWLMEGYPVARTASPGGRWVYTLYSNPNNYPFVHALDTVSRTAVCVGIPLNWTTAETTVDSSTLSVKGNELVLSSGYVLDRTTFKVTKT